MSGIVLRRNICGFNCQKHAWIAVRILLRHCYGGRISNEAINGSVVSLERLNKGDS
jgi:hypothetical protein